MQRQPMDRRLMREINQNTLLNLIRAHAPISRTELKKLSGLSLGTIVGITAALIEQQFVAEMGMAESTGGRKAGLLEIAPEGGYVLGIELRERLVAGALLNLHGDVVYEESWPVPLRNNATQAVALLSAGVETFIEHSCVPRKKILGLGCGISGPVNARAGTSVDSWILNWHNVELVEPLTARLNMPVFVDNAVNCLASYEKLYGDGRHYHDFLLVTLGRGLGMAAVVRDDLYRGALGLGGEFGHIPFHISGRLCECGKQGCLEAYVADHGIVTTYYELTADVRIVNPGEIDTPEIDALYERACQGDAQADQAFKLTGEYLGIGLATLVNLFNPQCIILNNGGGHRADLLLASAQSTMYRHIFSQLGKELSLIVVQGDKTINWARGAGCLVLRDFFSSPANAS